MTKTSYIVRVSMLAAVATMLYFFLEVPIIPGMSHLKVNLSDVPAVIAAITMGPLSALIVEFLKAAFHLLRSTTFGIGELIDFILGSAMVLSFYAIYCIAAKREAGSPKSKYYHGIYFAGIVVSVTVTIIIGAALNYLLYPVFFRMLGNEIAEGMLYAAVIASVPVNIVRPVATFAVVWPFSHRLRDMAGNCHGISLNGMPKKI